MDWGRWGWVGALVWVLAACGDDGPTADGGPESGTASTDATPATAGTDGSTDGADTTAGDDTGSPAARPNWHEDIAPLVVEHCTTCHSGGGIAPFPLATYEQSGPIAEVMALQAEAGLMPPWHALETEKCTPPAPFEHDARLPPDQIQLLRDWADANAPEGDPALAAPLPDPPSYDLEDTTATAAMTGSITIQPEGSALDFFHCLSLDPGNTEDVYIDGMQVIPGNPAIAHHVLIYVDTNATSASWPGGVNLDCGGGAGVGGALLVGGWVPGSLPTTTPPGVGIRLPAGARLIFNMHYHAVVTGAEVDDGTALALRWQSTPPEYVSEFRLVGAPGDGALTTAPFSIPANASGHQEVVEWEIPNLAGTDVRLWSVVNHMHKVGVDMKSSVLRGDTEHCLVQTPRWDFNWQRFYEYDVPIDQAFQFQDGDVMRVRCTYDNTLKNPAVVQALGEVGLDEPQTVQLGEGTLDEMCLAGIGVAVRQ